MTHDHLDESGSAEHQPNLAYAGFWIRVGATFLDTLFLMGVSLLIFNPMRRFFGYYGDFFSSIDLLELFFILFYYFLLTWWTGQTLGKIIMGIRVIPIGAKRQTLSVGQVLLREWIGKPLCSLPFGLGYMWVGWNKKKQGWQDLIAHTFVIREKR